MVNNKLFLFFLFSLLFLFVQSQELSYKEAFPNITFNFPTEIQASVDGTNRMFVVEQPGFIKVFPNKEDVTTLELVTFLDISSNVAYSAGQEIGLLGLAFHPNFRNNGYIFVYYIDQPSNYRINIVRYTVDSSNPNLIDSSSRTIIAQYTKNQSDSNHNGGKIAFGPDGYLYISIGDGGGGGDPQGNGQNLNTVFGSMLRIDVDLDGNNPLETNPELPDGNYEIPSDNPRVGLSGLDEIYAWGTRNTWKFSFDPTGNLWGTDVGQNSYEEINIITKGGNYGWNKFEANTEPSYGSETLLATSPDIKPIFFYDHNASDLSITGGYTYNGSLTNNSLKDKYIYGDYVSGRVWALEYNPLNGATSNELLFKTNGEFISSFGEDETGELYFSDYGENAKIFKITETVTGPVTTPVNGTGEWKSLSLGTNGIVEAITTSTNGLSYIAGSFSSAGGINVSNLATLSTNEEWATLSVAVEGTILTSALAMDGTLYIAGDFTTVNGIEANNIAKWNGSSWSSLSSGTNGQVSTIDFNEDGVLFVGGVFTTAGGLNANNIAKWENENWSLLTDASTNISGTNNEVRSIHVEDNGQVYVGGNFDTAGGIAANRIALWNGTNWSALGSGTSGFVQAIESIDNYLYVGGNFAIAGDKTVNRITRYDKNSSTWQAMGTGVSGNINAITHSGPYIYVGGTFDTASDNGSIDKVMNNIARWSEQSGWEALGTGTNVGVNTRVNTLQFIKDETQLLVGGNFDVAGNVNANNIAIWAEAFCTDENVIPEYFINGSWNSGSDNLTITEGEDITLSILPNNTPFSITLPEGDIVENDYLIENASQAQSGIYTFTTIEGCTRNFTLIIDSINIDDGDDDGDGVLNSDDFCPNTPSEEMVDENGCIATSYPTNQFKITSTGTSCIGSENGSVLIESITTEEFSATITGEGVNSTIPFTETLSIKDLANGDYNLCISPINSSNYQTCSKIVITEPVSLSVFLDFNALTNEANINMSGAEEYTVQVNGKSFQTKESQITLPLIENINNISISTDQLCQGKYEETIYLGNTAIIYPNPVGSILSIDLKSLTIDKLEIAIFTEAGVLLHSSNLKVEQSIIEINTSILSSGIYFLRLKNGSFNKSFKLLKQ
nr:PQQ-dependent sugar dehydrogenase [Maribacter dokdonensis]